MLFTAYIVDAIDLSEL